MRTTSGFDWVWFPTRLAIYARDGWRCLACGCEAGEKRLERLSLDHVKGLADGGSNKPVSCNSRRHTTPLKVWRPDLVAVARVQVRRPLDRAAARALALELRPQRFRALAARNARRGQPSPELAAVPF